MEEIRKQVNHQKDLGLEKKSSKKNSKKNTKHQFAASFSEDMLKNLNLGEEDPS